VGGLGADADAQKHPAHHREVTEFHQHDSEKCTRGPPPVVDGLHPHDQHIELNIGSSAITELWHVPRRSKKAATPAKDDQQKMA
jgi:hypothetical protein